MNAQQSVRISRYHGFEYCALNHLLGNLFITVAQQLPMVQQLGMLHALNQILHLQCNK